MPKLKRNKGFKPYKLIYLSLMLIELFMISQNLLYLKFISKNPEMKVSWGASFSAPYARSFGLDPRVILESALNDFKFNQIRLMSYWEDIQPNSADQFNFDELDWQVDLVRDHGKKVTLSLGLRQPRWPECHQPRWAKQMNYSPEWESKLNNFISAVVNRYKQRPEVVSWQLENEAKLKTFGDCADQTINTERLNREMSLIKNLDQTRPVIMSTSDQYGLPLGDPKPDIYGFSIYTRVTIPGTDIKFSYLQTPFWHGARAELVNLTTKKPVFVHELQAEPWGNGPIQSLSLAEQNQTMSAEGLKYNLLYSKNIGVTQADVWGIKWWYWRSLKLNDDSILNTAKEVINN